MRVFDQGIDVTEKSGPSFTVSSGCGPLLVRWESPLGATVEEVLAVSSYANLLIAKREGYVIAST
jgi:hypothetical protein